MIKAAILIALFSLPELLLASDPSNPSLNLQGGSPSQNPVCVGVPVSASVSGSYSDPTSTNSEFAITNHIWNWTAGIGGCSPTDGDGSTTWTNTFNGPRTNVVVVTATVRFQGYLGTNYWETSTNASVTNTIIAVAIEKVQYQDCSGNWADIGNFKIPKGKSVSFKAIASPHGVPFPSGTPVWGGEASGVGDTTTVTFNNTSSSDSDLKTIICGNCGATVSYPNFLICNTILDIIATQATRNSYKHHGHAYINVSDLNAGTDISYGAYPLDFAGVTNYPQAAPGSCVRIGADPIGGLHIRHFLLAPSQTAALAQFIQTPFAWHRWWNCATWASGAQPNDISALDWLPIPVFPYLLPLDTPRAIGASIDGLELTEPTTLIDPKYEQPVSCGWHGAGGSW